VEEARLTWFRANGDPAARCACPRTNSRYGPGTKQHTEKCRAKTDEADRRATEWGIEELVARSVPEGTKRCPGCGEFMVTARAPGARFPN